MQLHNYLNVFLSSRSSSQTVSFSFELKNNIFLNSSEKLLSSSVLILFNLQALTWENRKLLAGAYYLFFFFRCFCSEAILIFEITQRASGLNWNGKFTVKI